MTFCDLCGKPAMEKGVLGMRGYALSVSIINMRHLVH